ncbi:hypothetical protein M422DRAFT_37141 [Sphaerobolus stellatus SS14]|uniref:Uncharacterized protein n=1 Tax=Sphaerobolus stellatus (strain SS14) TaxID=990650 RepID=A0A0C9U418_SPHS4|nr:hypothetical protein M422DRAFT_37141 [Sphaerobolus stellatus SS14]
MEFGIVKKKEHSPRSPSSPELCQTLHTPTLSASVKSLVRVKNLSAAPSSASTPTLPILNETIRRMVVVTLPLIPFLRLVGKDLPIDELARVRRQDLGCVMAWMLRKTG